MVVRVVLRLRSVITMTIISQKLVMAWGSAIFTFFALAWSIEILGLIWPWGDDRIDKVFFSWQN
jgi:hypothetical protein